MTKSAFATKFLGVSDELSDLMDEDFWNSVDRRVRPPGISAQQFLVEEEIEYEHGIPTSNELPF